MMGWPFTGIIVTAVCSFGIALILVHLWRLDQRDKP